MFGAQELCLAPGFILGKDSSETPINFEVETDIQEIPLSVENLAMSFGGPGGGQKAQKPTPPERGSFPLDHDGECKPIIAGYLRCLRRGGGINDQECRLLAKTYLQCRMEHNLMAPDELKNLGFKEESQTTVTKGDGVIKIQGSST